MTRRSAPVVGMVVALVAGCEPPPSPPIMTDKRRPVAPAGDPKYTADISAVKFEFGGVPIRLGETPKAELDKLLGGEGRDASTPGAGTRLAVWDEKGVRAFYGASTGLVTTIDFMLTPPAELGGFPAEAFVGVLRVGGIRLSATTTRAEVEATGGQAVKPFPLGLPGFEIPCDGHAVHVFTAGSTPDGIAYVKVLRGPEGPAAEGQFRHLAAGNLAFMQQKYDKAIELYRMELDVNPDSESARRSLGRCHHEKREYDEAIAVYDETLRRHPKSEFALLYRGWTWKAKKDYARAVADFEKAAELYPDHIEGHQELAWLLATCPSDAHRDGRRAVRVAEQLFEAAGKSTYYSYWVIRAAAQAEAGDFAAAVATQETAVANAQKRGDVPAATMDALRNRLELYRQKKPYREE